MYSNEVVKIKDWLFDANENTLTSPITKVTTLEPIHAAVLLYLVQNHRQEVSRQQLAEDVWKSSHVDERTINATISKIRAALGGGKTEYIKTIPSVGYSLVCELSIFQPQVEKGSETNIERIDVENKQSANLPERKFLLILLSFALLITFVVLVSYFKASETSDYIQQVPITPVTFLEGQELYPAMSPKEDYLAFVYAKDATLDYRVIVQDRKTHRTAELEKGIFSTSPHWSANGQYLYYQTFENQQCLIKRARHTGVLEFSPPEVMANCGTLASMSPIGIDKENNWLYYSFKNSSSTPYYITRKNITTQDIETLTAPKGRYYGDYSLSLSPDGSKLAFLRSINKSTKYIMVLELETGNTNEVAGYSHFMFSITWKNDDEILFINDKVELTSVSIDDKKLTKLYQFSDKAFTPENVNDTSILLSLGTFYKGGVFKKNLTNSESVITTVISSSFNDHSATVNSLDNNMVAFISDRSGFDQIWLSDKGDLSPLTEHTNDKITNLQFSNDGLSLLYLKDNQLFIYQFKLGASELVFDQHKVKNPIWSCRQDNIVLASIYLNDIWTLVQLDLFTGQKVVLLPSIASIKSDCPMGNYYVTKGNQHGIFKLNENLTSVDGEVLLPEYHFIHGEHWGIINKAIYFNQHGVVHKFNIVNHELTQEQVDGQIVTNFHLNGTDIYLSIKILNNNYIAEIPINPNKSQ